MSEPSITPRLFALCLLSFFSAFARAQTIPDPRGPLAPSIGHVMVNSTGVQSTQRISSPVAKEPWNPQWIWVSAPTESSVVKNAHFRINCVLPKSARLTHAQARFSADKSARLWVNGKLVARGPDDPGSDEILSQNWSHQWLYTSVDIAPYLHSGDNVIAAEVLGIGRNPGYSLQHAGFAFQVSIKTLGRKPIVIESGSSWKAHSIAAYGEGQMPQPDGASPDRKPEIGLTYDARKDDDPAWRTSSFDVAKWPSAVKVQSVWGTLLPSMLPARMEVEYPIQAIALPAGEVRVARRNQVRLPGNGSFSVDFDRVLAAYASFAVKGSAGTVITLEPAETKTKPNPRRSVQVTLRDGITYFEHPAYDGFSTIRVIVSDATGPVEFQNIRANFTSTPVGYLGSFSTSDQQLNELWTASRWLTQLCMQDHYLDSPNHQEPIGDFGDYIIEAAENNYAFNQQELTRQDLRKFAGILDHAGSVNFHTSYSLLWLQMIMEYYDQTGDASLPLELRPSVDRLLAHFASFRGANGLLSEAPNYMFMDWVTISGFQTHHPPSVIGQGYLTAFYYNALANGARLAALAGDLSQQTAYVHERAELAAAFNRELWDPIAGLYRDGRPNQNHQPIGRWLPEDKDIETHSVHVNSLAVLYDLAPRERQPAIMNRLNQTGPLNVQPYFMHFVFAAEVHADVFDRWAVEQMHRWHLNPETKTYKEMFGGGDFSHGWGGTPLIQMSAHILGVSAAAPGYRKILLAPHPSGLAFARGSVPTRFGVITVSWFEKNGIFTLDASVPKNTSLQLALQDTLAQPKALEIDGKAREVANTIDLTGGTHRITIKH